MPIVFFSILFTVFAAWSEPVRSTRVQMTFEPKNTSLQLKVYELPLERGPDVGETEVAPLSQPLPKYKSMPEGFFVKKGGFKPFLMVVENTTKETKYFFAATHSVYPETASVGFRLGCLCNNHVFQVPPESRWTRVGQISIESFAPGETIKFVHKLIGLTKEDIKNKGLEKNVVTGN